MRQETLLKILDEVNDLLLHNKGTRSEVNTLLQIVAPYVNSTGGDAHTAYIAAKQRMEDPRQPLLSPRTGARLIG